MRNAWMDAFIHACMHSWWHPTHRSLTYDHGFSLTYEKVRMYSNPSRFKLVQETSRPIHALQLFGAKNVVGAKRFHSALSYLQS